MTTTNTTGGFVCGPNTITLVGSAFEIDTDANLIVDNTGCIDWLSGGTGTGFRSGVLQDPDQPSGTGDDSFGQGTKEDDTSPTIVDGSIPNNKSDLKVFGLYQEQGQVTPGNPSGKYLELFWTRINSPQGTTNMDFELNKLACNANATPPTNCSSNVVPIPGTNPTQYEGTPLRSDGDKLITYDLAKGGTVPTISIRTWSASNNAWGPATVISTAGNDPDALGSINSSTITAANSDGLGGQDPLTFGEVAVKFKVLFGTGTCGAFGSAYLKSRSSDAFTSEVKDFIKPKNVTISNCTGLTTSATATQSVGSAINDTATLTGATTVPVATGTMTFRLYGPFDANTAASGDVCDTAHQVTTYSSVVPISGPDPVTGAYTATSANYTPTSVTYATAGDRYQWTASYSGDGSNAAASTGCRDSGENSVVTKANSSLATKQKLVPNDHVDITPSSATGTVTFYLFKPSQTCSVANETVAASVYQQTVTLSGGSADTTNTSNTDTLAGSHANALGTWHWIVHYGGDGALNGSDGPLDSNSACTEAFTISE